MPFGFLTPVFEFSDPVFEKTSPKRLFSITENERLGLVFAKTGSVNLGTRDSGYVLYNIFMSLADIQYARNGVFFGKFSAIFRNFLRVKEP